MIIRFTLSTGLLLAMLTVATGQTTPLVFTYGTLGVTERGIKVAEDGEGNFLFIGDRYSYVDTNNVQPSNVDLEFFKVSPAGEVIWSGLMDSTLLDGGLSVIGENDGSYTILARDCNTVQGGVGCSKQNPRLYHLDTDGNLVWYKSYHEGYSSLAANFVKTPDGGYAIMGITTKYSDLGDLYLIKVDEEGEELWEALVPTTGGRAFDVAAAPGGGYYIAGSSIEATGRTAGVSRISESGQVLWTKYYTKAGFTGRLVAPLGDGFGLLLTNTTSDFIDTDFLRMDADGVLLEEKDLEGEIDRPTDAVAVEDGYVVTGLDELVSEDDKVAKVVKYNLDGDLVWSKTHNPYPDYYEHPTGIIATENGFVISGFTELADTVVYVYPEELMLFLLDRNGDIDSLETPNGTTETANPMQARVYPNPASEQVVFQCPAAQETPIELRIFNALGQVCSQATLREPIFRMARNGLGSGLYFYEMRTQEGAFVAKGKLIFE